MDISSQKNESSKIPFFDENDDFDFKPLSDGLGFHHEEKIKLNTNQIISKPTITKNIRSNTSSESREILSNSINQATKQNYIQSDLALFYENKNPNASPSVESEPKFETEALKTIRFAAFVFDFSLVSLVTFFTLSIVSKFTGIDFIQQLTSFEEMSMISVVFIFFSYYFIYFTLLEKMQGKTLGMDLFGIKMESVGNLSLVDIFIYEVVVLLGFFSLGITNFMNLPRLICGIKLIEKK